MVRVKLTSSDGSIAFERRFVGHIESINQVAYVYPFFLMGKDYELADLLHQTAQKPYLKLRRKHVLSSNGERFNELYPIFNL